MRARGDARHPGFAAATARRTQGAPTQDAPRATHAPDIAPSAPRLRPAPANPKVETPRTKDVVGVMTRVIRDDWLSYVVALPRRLLWI